MRNIDKQLEFLGIVDEYIQSPLVQTLKEKKGHNGAIDRYEHSLTVAYKSYKISKKLGLDFESAAIGGLLHDVGIYDDVSTKIKKALDVIKHPKLSENLAKDNFNLTSKQTNIIKSHMWPICLFTLPTSAEALIVNAMDTYCAAVEYLHLHNRFMKSKETYIFAY